MRVGARTSYWIEKRVVMLVRAYIGLRPVMGMVNCENDKQNQV